MYMTVLSKPVIFHLGCVFTSETMAAVCSPLFFVLQGWDFFIFLFLSLKGKEKTVVVKAWRFKSPGSGVFMEAFMKNNTHPHKQIYICSRTHANTQRHALRRHRRCRTNCAQALKERLNAEQCDNSAL